MMNKGSYRYLAALGLGLLLSEARAEYWTVDTLVKDFSQVSALIARGELQAAESSLNTLRQHTASNDVRIGQYQRELANAYLKQGRQQLQAGNAAAANATLSQGQQHLSAASPALKQEYQASLAASAAESGTKPAAVAAAKPQTQSAPAPAKVAAKPAVAAENPAERREDVERRLQEAEAIIAKKEAERARQQKLAEENAAAEREARAQQAAAAQPAAAPAPAVAKVEAAAPVVAAAPRARLIDPAAASSSVPMPMLDANDRESLRNLLDQVAADVVAFDCAVRLEVREAKDYPFVAALLSARIKKLDPAFAPQFSPVLKPDQEPRLVLSPQSNG
jgi:hypothetical protein